jgi:hypothetical protein
MGDRAGKKARSRDVTTGTRHAPITGVTSLPRLRQTIMTLAATVAALTAPARLASGAEDDAGAPVASLRQEWVGVEVTPASIALASCCDFHGGELDRYQAGPGAGIRFGRHRWEVAYIIPIEAGVYVSSRHATIFAHVEVEGGVIVPGTDRRLELGMGTGLGGLAMSYGAVGCDGSCVLGGAGWMVSFVGRYLFVAGPTMTVGASVRAVIPLSTPGDWIGHYTGGGNLLLGGLEVGFGRG